MTEVEVGVMQLLALKMKGAQESKNLENLEKTRKTEKTRK